MKVNHENDDVLDDNPVDMLLAKLSEQQAEISKQRSVLKAEEDTPVKARILEYISTTTNSDDSVNAEIVDGSVTSAPPAISSTDSQATVEDVLRLKLELQLAKGKIARMDQELAQNRITKHTLDQVIGLASETDFQMAQSDISRRSLTPVYPFDPSIRSQSNQNGLIVHEDARSDISDTFSAHGFNRARTIWNNGKGPTFKGMTPFQQTNPNNAGPWVGRSFGPQFCEPMTSFAERSSNDSFQSERVPTPDFLSRQAMGSRNNGDGRAANRNGPCFPYANTGGSYDGFSANTGGYGSGNTGFGIPPLGGHIPGNINLAMNVAGGNFSGYQPQPIGTPLSPHAPEFTSSVGSYKNEVSIEYPVLT